MCGRVLSPWRSREARTISSPFVPGVCPVCALCARAVPVVCGARAGVCDSLSARPAGTRLEMWGVGAQFERNLELWADYHYLTGRVTRTVIVRFAWPHSQFSHRHRHTTDCRERARTITASTRIRARRSGISVRRQPLREMGSAAQGLILARSAASLAHIAPAVHKLQVVNSLWSARGECCGAGKYLRGDQAAQAPLWSWLFRCGACMCPLSIHLGQVVDSPPTSPSQPQPLCARYPACSPRQSRENWSGSTGQAASCSICAASFTGYICCAACTQRTPWKTLQCYGKKCVYSTCKRPHTRYAATAR